MEEIKKIFWEKIEKQRRPEFFPFLNPGDYVIGKVVYTYKSNFGDPGREEVEVTVIKAIDPEIYKDKLFSLPNNTTLISGLKRESVEIDDYIMVLYDGETQTKRKFPVKLFLVAKMTEEEFEQALKTKLKAAQPKAETPAGKAPQPAEDIPQPKTPQAVAEAPKPKAPQPEAGPLPKEPAKPADEQTLRQALELAKDLLDFYESMPVEQLMNSLRSAGIEIPAEALLEHIRSFAEVANNVVKIKR